MKKFDGIIAMNKGTVAETGTFAELMEKKGYFYSLFHVSQQAQEDGDEPVGISA